MSELRYPYKPRLLAVFFGVLLFSAFAFLMGHTAYDSSIALGQGEEAALSSQGEVIFGWAVSVFFATMSFFGAFVFVKGFASNSELILTEKYVQAPRSGISKKIVTLNFEDVTNLTIQRVHSVLYLNIFHDKGRLTIVSAAFSKDEDFSFVAHHISSRVNL